MTLEYELLADDYRQIARAAAVARRQRSSRMFAAAFLCAIGLFLLVYRDQMSSWIAPALLLLTGLTSGIYAICAAHTSFARYTREAESTSRKTSLTTADDGLQFCNEFSQSHVRWAMFDHFTETRDLFIAFHTPIRVSFCIPKRAFTSEQECAEFRNLLAEKIGTISRRAGGFPVVIADDAHDRASS